MARTGYTFGGWRCWSGNLVPVGFSWMSYGGGFLFYAEWIPDGSPPAEIAGFDVITRLQTYVAQLYDEPFIHWHLQGDIPDLAKDATYLVLVFHTAPNRSAHLSWFSQSVGGGRIYGPAQVPMYDTVVKINLAQTLGQYARFVTSSSSSIRLRMGGWHLYYMPMPTVAFLSNGASD